MLVGPYPSPKLPKAKWFQVGSLSDTSSRIYFNYARRGIHLIAYGQLIVSTHPLSLQRPSCYPKGNTIGEYFFTTASLERVAHITICQRVMEATSPIVGLLLRYSNGDRSCVGEFRLDSANETIEVGTSETLSLGFAKTAHRYPYVARVQVCPPIETDSLVWLVLPWKGKLEWWFSSGQCRVYHDKQMSPPMV
jgi:hypothetical protein